MNSYEKAMSRIENEPELQAHEDTICYDWNEGDSHWEWVATAPITEIVDWAETIEAQEN